MWWLSHFSVDVVFITVGDQATAIKHFFKRRVRAFSKVGCNHDQFNCWSVDFLKSRVPSHACLEVDSDSSWNSLANWNWSGTTPVFTQKEDSMVVLPDHWPLTIVISPYLNKFFDLCLPRQWHQKCLLTPTNITTRKQRWRPQTSMEWQVFHEPQINPQAHGVPP